MTCGSAAALLYLMLRYRIKGDGTDPRLYLTSPPPQKRRVTVRRLLAITVPIAVGSVATNVAGLIDATFLQNRLSSVLALETERLLACFPDMIPAMYLENPQSIPTYLYGCYTLAMTIYLLVPALTQAFGISALPAVTDAWARRNRQALRDRIEAACRITALFCFPAGLGISALAEPIVRILYGDDCSSPIIAGVLTFLGIASLAAAMTAPLASMLQAVGRADLPVKLLIGAMVIKLGINWALCGIPEINIYGAAAGTLVCYLFLTSSQFFCLRRETGLPLSPGKLFLRPLLCAALCGLSARACFSGLGLLLPDSGLGEFSNLAVSILAGACLYVFSLFLLGGIEKNDLKMLPKGQKIAKTLEKRGWI